MKRTTFKHRTKFLNSVNVVDLQESSRQKQLNRLREKLKTSPQSRAPQLNPLDSLIQTESFTIALNRLNQEDRRLGDIFQRLAIGETIQQACKYFGIDDCRTIRKSIRQLIAPIYSR
jgi:hypothetical protein